MQSSNIKGIFRITSIIKGIFVISSTSSRAHTETHRYKWTVNCSRRCTTGSFLSTVEKVPSCNATYSRARQMSGPMSVEGSGTLNTAWTAVSSSLPSRLTVATARLHCFSYPALSFRIARVLLPRVHALGTRQPLVGSAFCLAPPAARLRSLPFTAE